MLLACNVTVDQYHVHVVKFNVLLSCNVTLNFFNSNIALHLVDQRHFTNFQYLRQFMLPVNRQLQANQ